MAVYYVDGDNGNDNNNGQSKDTAFRTIGKFASVAQPGDTCYVKPTTYRLSAYVTLPNGSDENYIRLIGDKDGEIWGIKGYPRITNYQSNETDYYNIDRLIQTGAYNELANFFFDYLYYYYEAYVIFINDSNVKIHNNTIIFYVFNPQTFNYAIKTNIGKINIDIYNNVIFGIAYNQSRQLGISIYRGSDIEQNINIYNNIFINTYYAIYQDFAYLRKVRIYNNLFMIGFYAVYTGYSYTADGHIYNNILFGIVYFSNRTYTAERNYELFNHGPALNGVVKFLPNFFKIVEPIGRWSHNIDGNAITNDNIPDTDIFGNPRPLGAGYDVGPMELFNYPIQESQVKRSGNYSIKFNRAGFQDFKFFVASGNRTVSVYTKWSNYSGTNKPQLIVLKDPYCGINSDQVTTATGGGSDWEQLSLSLSLSSDAEITVRIYARDTGENAVTYFDDLLVT